MSVLIASLAASAVIWCGCSIEKHYDALSFFFDGVPAPGTGATDAATGRSRRQGAPVIVSSHTAFAEARCSDCHGESVEFGLVTSGFSETSAEVCLKCHRPVLEEYPRMHGPVAAIACLWCHQPHDSVRPHLLILASPQVCLRCHGFQLKGPPRAPGHEDLDRDCLDCHHGHGGEAAYFLKPPAAGPIIDGETGSFPTSIEPKEAGAANWEQSKRFAATAPREGTE
ncbi:MAG: cytochrome c3 family protein [Planctomycetota bacterium]|jgi:predicted CXXCH cytochrome family protein